MDDARRAPVVVLLGRQGSGKGTQAARLASDLGLVHLSTGEALRQAVREGTPTGRRVAALLEAGRLVPDGVVLHVVAEHLEEPVSRRRGVVLDGYPRTRSQAEDLVALLGPDGLTAALDLDVSLADVRRRLLARRVCPVCGTNTVAPAGEDEVPCPNGDGPAVRRADDTPEAIDRRLAEHEAQAGPLLGFLAERGVLVTVDASGTPDEVAEQVRKAVHPLLWGRGLAVG